MDPLERARALAEYGKLVFGIVRLTLGTTRTVEVSRSG
jgi:hypothetical protein